MPIACWALSKIVLTKPTRVSFSGPGLCPTSSSAAASMRESGVRISCATTAGWLPYRLTGARRGQLRGDGAVINNEPQIVPAATMAVDRS